MRFVHRYWPTRRSPLVSATCCVDPLGADGCPHPVAAPATASAATATSPRIRRPRVRRAVAAAWLECTVGIPSSGLDQLVSYDRRGGRPGGGCRRRPPAP